MDNQEREPSAVPSLSDLQAMIGEGRSFHDLLGARKPLDGEDLYDQSPAFDAAVARLYNDTADGRLVIETLLNATVRQASWVGGLMQSSDTILAYGLFREGQNSIAAMFAAAMHRHDLKAEEEIDNGPE